MNRLTGSVCKFPVYLQSEREPQPEVDMTGAPLLALSALTDKQKMTKKTKKLTWENFPRFFSPHQISPEFIAQYMC